MNNHLALKKAGLATGRNCNPRRLKPLNAAVILTKKSLASTAIDEEHIWFLIRATQGEKMNTVKAALATIVALGTLTANAKPILDCTIMNADTNTHLVLDYATTGSNGFVVELIDPTALRPTAHLTISDTQVFQGPSVVVADVFESHVGTLQLIAKFTVGSSNSESVTFTSSYRRDEIRNDYGLLQLASLSDAGLMWTCER
jgi:hypothetical protein